MLDGRSKSNNTTESPDAKSSLPNDEMSQVSSDLDDEIPF